MWHILLSLLILTALIGRMFEVDVSQLLPHGHLSYKGNWFSFALCYLRGLLFLRNLLLFPQSVPFCSIISVTTKANYLYTEEDRIVTIQLHSQSVSPYQFYLIILYLLQIVLSGLFQFRINL